MLHANTKNWGTVFPDAYNHRVIRARESHKQNVLYAELNCVAKKIAGTRLTLYECDNLILYEQIINTVLI